MIIKGLSTPQAAVYARSHFRPVTRTASIICDSARALTALSAAVDVHARFAGRTCLLQGASRGLGAEFVKQLLGIEDTRVIATCRSPETAHTLQQLKEQHGDRLLALRLDVCDERSIQEAYAQVASQFQHLDLLINVTGVLHIPGQLQPETSLSKLEPSSMMLSFQTNAMGPLLVCKAFSPLLLKSPTAAEHQPAIIANMSARIGSIGDNQLGGWYSYRASKAALNMLTKTMAIELARKKRNIACVLLHPGTCDTDLTKPFQKNLAPEKLFTREKGVQQLLSILGSLTASNNARYLAWDGTDIPW